MIADSARLELCWGTVGLTPIEELVDAAAAAGFCAVTIASSECAEVVANLPRLRRLRERLAATAVTITTIDPLVNGLPGLRGASVMPEQYRGLLRPTADDCGRFAEAIGATIVNVAHVTGQSAPVEQLADAIGGIAATLAEYGARASVEFIPGTGIATLESVRGLVRAIGATNVGITFDTWHFRRAGGVPADLDDLDAGEILSLQINDAMDLEVGGPHMPATERLLPGRGTLPLRDTLERLLGKDPDLVIGVEVFSDQLRDMRPRRAAEVAYEAACGVLAGMTVADQSQ